MMTPPNERKILRSTGAAIILALVGLVALASADVSAQTGSRIGSDSNAESVYWLGEPGEITEVRKLLSQGKVEEALKVAEDFLAYLDSSGSIQGGHLLSRYFALNAFCVALTSSGRLDEAMAECSSAVDLSSKHWQAFNSRGVVFYLVGRLDDALADYRAALQLVPRKSGPAGIIRHNIELAEVKKQVS